MTLSNAVWKRVRLADILTYLDERVDLEDDKEYLTITVKRRHGGLEMRERFFGHEIMTKKQFRLVPGSFIISRIQCWHQAYAIVGDVAANAIASTNYDQFAISPEVHPLFFWWLSYTPEFTETVRSSASGVVIEKMVFNRNAWLEKTVLIPPLAEQRRIVARIEELAAQIEEAVRLRQEVETDLHDLLMATYHKIADSAPRRPLGDVAPLIRRPVAVDTKKEYPQIAVRSFGRGTFHRPSLLGSDVTWQKPFLVKSGDILISNIKAWEGAVAVASPIDDGRVGSHRYLTCVPTPSLTTPRFVCFHLLTPEGLHEIGEASPGSADRNRTLGVKALGQIPIPIPPFEQQLWFDDLCGRVDTLKRLQAETAAELDALLPSILDRAFKGEL